MSHVKIFDDRMIMLYRNINGQVKNVKIIYMCIKSSKVFSTE